MSLSLSFFTFTIIVMVMNSNMANFGVSRTYSIVPPPVKKFNFPMVISFEAFVLEIVFWYT